MIVVDTSLALEILIRTPLGARHLTRILGEDVHVPHLLDVEFTSALRRLTQAGGIDPAISAEALRALGDWGLQRHAHTDLLARVWSLRQSLSAYDACFVALAEALDAPLLTCDAKLSRSHGHRARISLLS